MMTVDSLAQPRFLHCDLDAFFASVEVLLNPALAGKPVIVGGDPAARGVVSTASYEARAFGVHSAMPARTAQRLCPQGIFLRPRHHVYAEYSGRVFAVVSRFSDRIQRVSIDEAFVWLDQPDPVAAAQELKRAIKVETGLTVSVGLGTSKLVSKIASDCSKPDGFLVVAPGQEAAFLAPLPARKLWGVGPKTAARLAELRINTIGDIVAAGQEVLTGALGAHHAAELWRHARGVDESEIVVSREIKSISEETTFPQDEREARKLWSVLRLQCRQCAERLAAEGLQARTVTVKLRYGDFRTITRSLTLAAPTADADAFCQVVAAIMQRAWSRERRPLRLIGVRLAGLVPPPTAHQLPLFP